MNLEQSLVVAGAVVALTQLIKWTGLMKDSYGPLAIMVLSLFGVAIWGYSKGPTWERGLLFDYFTGWIAVATSSAGVFGFTRSAPAAVTTGSRNSSIPGAGQSVTEKMNGDVNTERRDR